MTDKSTPGSAALGAHGVYCAPKVSYCVTVTPTVMDGQVVRWRRKPDGPVLASASRNRVTIDASADNTTGVAALMDLLARADRARSALADGVDQSHLVES